MLLARIRTRCGDALAAGVIQTLSRPPILRRVFSHIAEVQPDHGFEDAAIRSDHIRFLAYTIVNREYGLGQLLQDLWVLFELREMRDGYFVEFGAVDGVVHSNTLSLERHFGWRGLLIEPNPDQFASLSRNRQCDIDHRCVDAISGRQVTLLLTDDPELSTIQQYANSDDHATKRLVSIRKAIVESVSLSDLLVDHQAPLRIDYMSIDTEGSELNILKSFDFSRWDIRLLSVEHNHRDSESELDALMFSRGYERRFREISGFDAWYRKIASP